MTDCYVHEAEYMVYGTWYSHSSQHSQQSDTRVTAQVAWLQQSTGLTCTHQPYLQRGCIDQQLMWLSQCNDILHSLKNCDCTSLIILHRQSPGSSSRGHNLLRCNTPMHHMYTYPCGRAQYTQDTPFSTVNTNKQC